MIGCALALLLSEPPSRADLERAWRYSERQNGSAMIVMHEGEVIFERYSDGGKETYRPLASGTKSFSGVAAMMAVDKGIFNLDEKVSDTITEWKEDPKKSKITVRQLLDLSSGLELARAGQFSRYSAAVDREGELEPGKTFRYGNTHYHAFGEFLKRKLKEKDMTVADFYDANIMDPLDISTSRWAGWRIGEPDLAGFAVLRAGDWARFGQLVLQGGKWKGKQLVKESSLKECFKPSKANPAYGLTFWLNPDNDAELPEDMPAEGKRFLRDNLDDVELWMALGAGKNSLYIVPERDLVVVRHGTGQGLTQMAAKGLFYHHDVFLEHLL